MKKIILLLGVLLACSYSFSAQGTIRFETEANGRGAIPNDSINTAGGSFNLSGNLFSGDISFTTTSAASGWTLGIRNASGGMIYQADRIQWEDVGAPFGYGYAFWTREP